MLKRFFQIGVAALVLSSVVFACSEDVNSPAGVDQRPSLGKADGGDAAAAILAGGSVETNARHR